MKSVTNKVKLFVLDPLWDDLVTKEQEKSLSEAGYELFVDKVPKPIKEVKGLFDGEDPRVLAINPDYVGFKLKNEDYATIPNLKGIFLALNAFGWVEQTAANELGIPVCNLAQMNHDSVAEWAVMMMFNLARQTPRLIKDGFPLDFDKDFMKYRGFQLAGKTAGIIGLGSIGSAIAERCKGLGMNVVYWSRSSTNEAYTKLPLKELLSTADVIFPATLKNDETAVLFSDDLLRTIKKEALVVDIVRILNQDLLLDMVKNSQLYGYGFEGEPKEFDKFDGNVWAAPAYAWATYESMQSCMAMLVENIVVASKGEYPRRVNTP